MARNLADGLREKLEYRRHHPMIPLINEDVLASMVGWCLVGALASEGEINKHVAECRKLYHYWKKEGLTYKRIHEICMDYIKHNERLYKTLSEIRWNNKPWSPYLCATLVSGPLKVVEFDEDGKEEIK